jgi:hypothetical protein
VRLNVLRAAFVGLIASSFATPALAAKPPSSKGGKSKKSDAGSDSGSTGGRQVAFFDLIRPENAGMMNLIPARVVLEPGSGIVSSRVTHLHTKPKKDLKGLVLVGGDTASVSVKPGTYSVQVLTPVADQPAGSYPAGKPRVWQSAVVKVVLSQGETICVVVEPGIEGTEYNGSWTIGKAESPADCGTMTHRVEPDDEAPPAAAPPAAP